MKVRIRVGQNLPEILMIVGAAPLLLATIAITSPFPEEVMASEELGRMAIASLGGWIAPAVAGAFLLGIGLFLALRKDSRIRYY